MSPAKTHLSYGVVRSPALAATARRHRTDRVPVGLGLAVAALLSVMLWVAATSGVRLLAALALG